MSGDAELLNFIYQNSQMGVDTIRQLIGVVEDKDLKEHLKTQFQGYEAVSYTHLTLPTKLEV